MNYAIHNSIVNFIWSIADEVLFNVYVRGKYRDVILPMTVIRRMDALLEPSKENVLAMKAHLDKAGIANQDAALCRAAGEAFYNASPFTLRDLKNRAKQQQLKADFEAYLECAEADNIFYGSTLSSDAFPAQEFDFMLSNPPYGVNWKVDLERLGGKGEVTDPRFVTSHDGDAEYTMLTRSSDGQLMFLVNKLSKMKHNTRLGSRIAEVHNGSSLFTGDAGQGESNIRRWIIENDWLEAIIALPENMFYNTGIATYIWILTNRKSKERKGKVQLIDATAWRVPLRRNLGKKNCEFSEEHIHTITDLILHPTQTEQSKLFPNEAFGYWKVTVDRPLRLAVNLTEERLTVFDKLCVTEKEETLCAMVRRVARQMGTGPHMDSGTFFADCEADADTHGLKFTAKRKKLLQSTLCDTNEKAAPVVKKVHKKAEPNPLHGLYTVTLNGKKCVVEYEPDTALRDSEQIPLLEEGGIEVFFRREVLPYTPDAWIDAEKIQKGYEISFTRHFYKPAPMRTLEEIRADILALEQETDGLLGQIMGNV